MVCNLTRDNDAAIKEILTQAEEARQTFATLIDDDMEGFDAVMRAYKLPSKDGSLERDRTLQNALASAAEAPLAMMETASALITPLAELVTLGNRNLITDVGVAAILIEATIHSARLNVLINLKSIKNAAVSGLMFERMERVMAKRPEVEAIIRQTHDLVV